MLVMGVCMFVVVCVHACLCDAILRLSSIHFSYKEYIYQLMTDIKYLVCFVFIFISFSVLKKKVFLFFKYFLKHK